MARWDARDWLLVGTLMPVWALCLALTLWDGLFFPQERLGFSVYSARSAE